MKREAQKPPKDAYLTLGQNMKQPIARFGVSRELSFSQHEDSPYRINPVMKVYLNPNFLRMYPAQVRGPMK